MPDAGKVLGQSLTLPDIKSSFLCGVLDVRAHPCVTSIQDGQGKRIPYFIVLGASLTITVDGSDLRTYSSISDEIGALTHPERVLWVQDKQ